VVQKITKTLTVLEQRRLVAGQEAAAWWRLFWAGGGRPVAGAWWRRLWQAPEVLAAAGTGTRGAVADVQAA
jgi:hypothetical protein